MTAPRVIDPELAARRRAAALKAWETMRATGRTPHAGRPKATVVRSTVAKTKRHEPPTVVLEFIPPRDTSNDEAEWAVLDAARRREWADVARWRKATWQDGWWTGQHCEPWGGIAGCRPSVATKAHPQSYGADMPMRGVLCASSKQTHKWPLTREEKAQLDLRPLKWIAPPQPAPAAETAEEVSE